MGSSQIIKILVFGGQVDYGDKNVDIYGMYNRRMSSVFEHLLISSLRNNHQLTVF